jgi:hypothetical protein
VNCSGPPGGGWRMHPGWQSCRTQHPRLSQPPRHKWPAARIARLPDAARCLQGKQKVCKRAVTVGGGDSKGIRRYSRCTLRLNKESMSGKGKLHNALTAHPLTLAHLRCAMCCSKQETAFQPNNLATSAKAFTLRMRCL